jgi:hypothetical protein
VSEHGQPVDEPPVDEPPVDEPPVDEPPVDEPPVDEQPTDAPGDPRVAAAVQRLEQLGDSPPDQHVEVYEQVHQVLQETLSDAQQDRSDGG